MKAYPNKFSRVMHANEAAAWGVVLSQAQVFSVYPITPQTTIPEKLAEFAEKGYLKAESLHMESEASAAAAVMGASRAGARVFTATSSQGLWLMAEQIYSAGLRRLPIIMVNVNRTIGPPFNIHLSHEDSLALRDIPWLQFYAGNAQEALDLVIMAYKIAEHHLLPIMICLDGFYLSHASEIVEVPSQKTVDQFLPPFRAKYALDVENPHIFEAGLAEDWTTEFRHALVKEFKNAKRSAEVAFWIFGELFGRTYQSIEEYKMAGAESAIICLGSSAGTVKYVLDAKEGIGLLRPVMLNPFPDKELKRSLKGVKKVAVIDRDHQGILAKEIRNALFYQDQKPEVFSFIAGLGGRDITVETVESVIATMAREEKAPGSPIWIDCRNGSLPSLTLGSPPHARHSIGEDATEFGNGTTAITSKTENGMLANVPSEEYVSAGEHACQGCGLTLALRYVLKGLGGKTVATVPASCCSVINGQFPNCAIRIPLQNVCFEEAAAEAAGIRAGLDALKKKGVNVLAFAGDGGTYDIGLQALSGAAERNDDILFVCYDNEAYMNTGIQRSSSTPFGAWSTTTPGKKPQWKKDIMAIMAAHKIPYCATASIAYPEDLLRKVRKAKGIKGCKFILIFSSCPTGWRFSPELSIKIARLAVATRIFPLYEIFHGTRYVINKMPESRPITDYLKTQGRFKNLNENDITLIQKNIADAMERLQKLALLSPSGRYPEGI